MGHSSIASRNKPEQGAGRNVEAGHNLIRRGCIFMCSCGSTYPSATTRHQAELSHGGHIQCVKAASVDAEQRGYR
jgi:hypothetical protein